MNDYRVFVYTVSAHFADMLVGVIMASQRAELLALLTPSERKRVYFR
jgi:hypothetical protein